MSESAGTPQAPSRFATTLLDLLDRVEYRRVSPNDVVDPVYRLRYEAYRREEFVAVNSEHVVRDEFDDLPNVHCFGVYIDGKLVSSVRVHHLTPTYRESPSHTVFTDILDPLLDEGMTILDPGRFTADYEASLAFPALPFLTLRIPVLAIWHFRANYCLHSIRPEHSAFYKRVFRSFQLGSERYYHGLTFPMVLYACDLISQQETFWARYPFYRSTPEEREMLFGSPGRAPLRIVRPLARDAQPHSEDA